MKRHIGRYPVSSIWTDRPIHEWLWLQRDHELHQRGQTQLRPGAHHLRQQPSTVQVRKRKNNNTEKVPHIKSKMEYYLNMLFFSEK